MTGRSLVVWLVWLVWLTPTYLPAQSGQTRVECDVIHLFKGPKRGITSHSTALGGRRHEQDVDRPYAVRAGDHRVDVDRRQRRAELGRQLGHRDDRRHDGR